MGEGGYARAKGFIWQFHEQKREASLLDGLDSLPASAAELAWQLCCIYLHFANVGIRTQPGAVNCCRRARCLVIDGPHT